MGTSFHRGSTPTLRFTVMPGISVSDPALGDPTVSIVQEGMSLIYDGAALSVDAAGNTVSVTIPADDSDQLGEGMETTAQLSYSNAVTEQVYHFPQHSLTILPSNVDLTFVEEEEEIEPDPEVIDDGQEDPEIAVLEDPAGYEFDEVDASLEDLVYDDYVEQYEEDDVDTMIDFEDDEEEEEEEEEEPE